MHQDPLAGAAGGGGGGPSGERGVCGWVFLSFGTVWGLGVSWLSSCSSVRRRSGLSKAPSAEDDGEGDEEEKERQNHIGISKYLLKPPWKET